MKNYYEILQIASDASEEVIRAAYKALGKKYHPDNQKYPAEFCQKKMSEINMAYEILSDSAKRKQYDYEYYQYIAKKSSESVAYTDMKEQEGKTAERTDDAYDTDKPEGLLKSLFRGVESMVQKNKQIIDNAYIEGTGMDNFELVRAYMQNYGFKRQGLSIVMEERELLIRNQDGKLVPTDKFRLYWR